MGGERVRPLVWPSLGGEDWSYVLQEVPGTMSYLGACLPDQVPGEAPGNHSNRVVFDEEAMAAGVAMHAAVALAHGHPVRLTEPDGGSDDTYVFDDHYGLDDPYGPSVLL